MTYLPDVEKNLKKPLLILIQYTNVTDSKTDGRTDRHHATT